MQAGNEPRSRGRWIHDCATEHAGMQVLRGTVHPEFQGGNATQGKGEGGVSVRDHASIGNHDYVAIEFRPVFIQKGAEVVAANLLFPFDEENNVRGQVASPGEKLAHTKDMGHDLALVVGRAPRIDAPVANRWLKGRCPPLFQRFRGLDIVVPVDENRRPRWIRGRSGNHRRMTSGLADVSPEAKADKLLSQPLCTGNHVRDMLGLSRYAWKLQELKKVAHSGIVHKDSIGC